MAHHSTALIIGGGVIGSSIALELAKKGLHCTILDKGPFFSEASTASAGMLCPQAEVLDSDNQSEFFQESGRLHRPWTEELESVSRIPVQYEKEGMLRVAFSEERAEKLMKLLDATDISATWLTPEEIKKIEPDITDSNYGGILFSEDGQLHPVHLAQSLRRALQRMGCEVKSGVPALSLITQQDRVIGVQTPEGNLCADHIILAAGAWSSALVSSLGYNLPVSPIMGQMCAVRSETLSIRKIIQGSGGMVIPRMDGTLTIGTTHERVGYHKAPTVSGVSQIYQAVTRDIPEMKDAEFMKTWAGLRPGTPDGNPYIGKLNGIEGLIVATGHYSVGILLAPITAKLISEIVLEERLSVDIQPFSPERFNTTDERGISSSANFEEEKVKSER